MSRPQKVKLLIEWRRFMWYCEITNQKLRRQRRFKELKDAVDWIKEESAHINCPTFATRKNAKDGFVYLMRDTRNGMVKIGFSVNPKTREKTLQSEQPETELIFFFKATLRTEKLLHLVYEKYRVRGEWFKLSEREINELTNRFRGGRSLSVASPTIRKAGTLF